MEGDTHMEEDIRRGIYTEGNTSRIYTWRRTHKEGDIPGRGYVWRGTYLEGDIYGGGHTRNIF